MSTYANVLIAGREFNVRSDGWDKETIRDCVREYVAEIKGKVKPGYLNTAVVDAIASESASDYYAPFSLGFCDFPSYRWKVIIGKRGGVKIKKDRERRERRKSCAHFRGNRSSPTTLFLFLISNCYLS